MTEGSLRKPQLNTNSSTSFHERLYQHCNTAGHLETIYLPPDLFFFFLFSDSMVWEIARGWLFQRRKKRLLGALYKGWLMPFKWTITNGVDMLLSKMNEVSLERQSSSNKSLRLSRAVILGDSFGLPSFFIINTRTYWVPLLFNRLTHTHTQLKKADGVLGNSLYRVGDKMKSSEIYVCPVTTSLDVGPVVQKTFSLHLGW